MHDEDDEILHYDLCMMSWRCLSKVKKQLCIGDGIDGKKQMIALQTINAPRFRIWFPLSFQIQISSIKIPFAIYFLLPFFVS